MMADLLGDVPVLLLEVHVFEGFTLSLVSLEKCAFSKTLTYEHGIKRFGDPAESRRII
jgi:hypothetical protein